MKKFYLILIALSITISAIFYFSFWWSIAALGAIMIFIASRFYAIRIQALGQRNEELDRHLEGLHIQLENAVLKEQRTSKDAEHIRQMKQQLFSQLSHEVRTPMNGVLGMALLLQETGLSTEQMGYITTIRNCSESLLASVNNILATDVLDFSKLQQPKDILEFRDFDLRDSIEEVLDLFADQVAKTGVDLVYYIDEDVPAQIKGDNKRFMQVMINLVENAVRFTHNGEIFVGIKYNIQARDGHPSELVIEIRDSGTGIEADQLEKLFNGIQNKSSQHISTGPSNGLGLVICRQLVELMGGHIEVRSEPGIGSIFNFRIPVIPGTKPRQHHLNQINYGPFEGKHILIIDDNVTSRDSLIRQMRSWKMSPAAAHSGMHALEILREKNNFDLVLVDIDMPDIDGIQTAKLIRDQCPSLQIIAMNRKEDARYRQQPDLFFSVLDKPIRQNKLRDCILRLLSETTAPHQNKNPITEVFATQFPLRILVAEDNSINQKIATKILAKLGYSPLVANNGKEAIEMISQERYDIIFMDVQMPEMDGLEATRLIRTCFEIQPVIIAMTANVMLGDRDACMQSGMDDYMSKPIELKELLRQLEKWALVIKEKNTILV